MDKKEVEKLPNKFVEAMGWAVYNVAIDLASDQRNVSAKSIIQGLVKSAIECDPTLKKYFERARTNALAEAAHNADENTAEFVPVAKLDF